MTQSKYKRQKRYKEETLSYYSLLLIVCTIHVPKDHIYIYIYAMDHIRWENKKSYVISVMNEIQLNEVLSYRL